MRHARELEECSDLIISTVAACLTALAEVVLQTLHIWLQACSIQVLHPQTALAAEQPNMGTYMHSVCNNCTDAWVCGNCTDANKLYKISHAVSTVVRVRWYSAGMASQC